MVHNRLLGNRVVRSTRPVQFIPAGSLPKDEFRSRRDEGHIQRCPSYPDPDFFLNFYQKYLFRHASLRGLRVEQLNRLCREGQGGGSFSREVLSRRAGGREGFPRYFVLTDLQEKATVEDTLRRRGDSDTSDDEEDEPAPPPDACHRHFDPYAEALEAGTVFKSEAQHVSGFRKRSAGRLGVGRPPFIEPVGAQREAFFEQR